MPIKATTFKTRVTRFDGRLFYHLQFFGEEGGVRLPPSAATTRNIMVDSTSEMLSAIERALQGTLPSNAEISARTNTEPPTRFETTEEYLARGGSINVITAPAEKRKTAMQPEDWDDLFDDLNLNELALGV